MSRLPRLDYPDALQYVCIKGVSTEPLFQYAEDFEILQQFIVEVISLYHVKLHLYCLLPNQAHVIIQTPLGNIAEVMHRITTKYTIYFNRRYKRCGPLLRGRFVSLVVEPGVYLLRLSRWIHLLPLTLIPDENPSNRKKLSALRRFQRTSFRAYTDLIDAPAWLTTSAIKDAVKQQRRSYSRYVREAIPQPDQTFDFLMARARYGIGSPRFIYELTRQLPGGTKVVKRHVLSPVIVVRTICNFFSVTPAEIRRRQRETQIRPITAWALSNFARLSQQQIAEELHISSSAAISVQLRSLAKLATEDEMIKNLLVQLETVFDEKINSVDFV